MKRINSAVFIWSLALTIGVFVSMTALLLPLRLAEFLIDRFFEVDLHPSYSTLFKTSVMNSPILGLTLARLLLGNDLEQIFFSQVRRARVRCVCVSLCLRAYL